MTLILSGTDGVSDIDGTAATPAIRGTDANTGIFFPAADTIAFAEGGAEAMRIDSSGRVGIGTTAPTYPLTVSGSSQSTIEIKNTSGTGEGRLYFSDDSATAIGGIEYQHNGDYMRFYTNNAERMRIDSSGRVGIGTTSMSSYAPGNLSSALSGDNYVTLQAGTSSASGINMVDSATSSAVGLIRYQHASDTMDFFTAGSQRVVITSGGNFLIGTTSSSTKFAVEDTSGNQTRTAYADDNSFATSVDALYVKRAATSAYQFLLCYSSITSDIEFNLRGDGNGYADGTWNNNGADYAEFFESANGQALTLGATVVLDGTKVREATDQDPAYAIIGVVRPKEPSKASMVVGNTAWNKWANKYLTDDFDRYIMEDHDVVEWEETITDEEGKTSTKQHSYESHNIPAGVTVPADAVRNTHDDKGNKFQHYKLNPAWNKDAEYVNRENRPEWNIIGLLGQVKILKGQPVGDRWIKMRDVSATVEEWMIR